jgi:transposase
MVEVGLWFGVVSAGPLIIVDGTMNGVKYQTMLGEVKETMEELYGDLGDRLFQQDNAPCHKAKRVSKWFEDENIPRIPWPAQSPDLNPIEPLWDELDHRIRKRKPLPANLTELKAALKEEWIQIPPPVYQKLILSMKERVSAVITAKGQPTRY